LTKSRFTEGGNSTGGGFLANSKSRIAVAAIVVILVFGVIGLGLVGFLPLGQLDTTTDPDEWTDNDLIDRGLVVPDWDFSMVGNYTVTMNELRGKVTVLDFMTTSCPACETQSVYMKALYEEIGDTVNILSLTVDMNETKELLEAWALDRSLTWPHGIDTNMDASLWCGMVVIPMIVIVDADGLLRWIHDGAWEFSGSSGMNATVHQIMS